MVRNRARFNFQSINLGNISSYTSGACELKDFPLRATGIN